MPQEAVKRRRKPAAVRYWAHRGGGRVAQHEPSPGWQPDLPPLEDDRTRRLPGESAHADLRRRSLFSRPAIDPRRRRRRCDHHAPRGYRADRARLHRLRSATSVDAPIDGERIQRLARGRRVLPSARNQRHRWCVPNDVRPGRRPRSPMHALDAASDWRSSHVTRRQLAWILIFIADVSRRSVSWQLSRSAHT